MPKTCWSSCNITPRVQLDELDFCLEGCTQSLGNFLKLGPMANKGLFLGVSNVKTDIICLHKKIQTNKGI